ncbi:MAG: hypothetical protein L3J97_02510 [Thermoplasmata archaeon]|nr:hypothetical protein [Thermoplasmata archaeon]
MEGSAELGSCVRELLTLDRSLGRSDKKVLEQLLLTGQPFTARQLGRESQTNPQALYPVLERLVRRGLVVPANSGGVRLFRTAHPSALIEELLTPAQRMRDLATGIEPSLRRIYEGGPTESPLDVSRLAVSTSSLTGCLSALIDAIRAVQDSVWVVGPLPAWLSHTPVITTELARAMRGGSPQIRIMSPAPGSDGIGLRILGVLRSAGIVVRYSERFQTPMILVDELHLFVQTNGASGSHRRPTAYLHVTAPELGHDLAQTIDEAWSSALPPRRTNLGEGFEASELGPEPIDTQKPTNHRTMSLGIPQATSAIHSGPASRLARRSRCPAPGSDPSEL